MANRRAGERANRGLSTLRKTSRSLRDDANVNHAPVIPVGTAAPTSPTLLAMAGWGQGTKRVYSWPEMRCNRVAAGPNDVEGGSSYTLSAAAHWGGGRAGGRAAPPRPLRPPRLPPSSLWPGRAGFLARTSPAGLPGFLPTSSCRESVPRHNCDTSVSILEAGTYLVGLAVIPVLLGAVDA